MEKPDLTKDRKKLDTAYNNGKNAKRFKISVPLPLVLKVFHHLHWNDQQMSFQVCYG